MFGLMPAYGFTIRHAAGIQFSDVKVGYDKEDRRPAFVLDQVSGVNFQHVRAHKASGIPTFVLKEVKDVTVANTHIDSAVRKEM